MYHEICLEIIKKIWVSSLFLCYNRITIVKKWRIKWQKHLLLTADKLEQITAEFPTPFHLYDEKGIRETARAVNAAFSWNPGFKEFFAVKATPNPAILKILKEEGCGVDCATDTELVMSKKIGFDSSAISFTSNDTRAEEFVYARDINATINLDAYEDIFFLEEAAGLPETLSLRFNPGASSLLVLISWIIHEEFENWDDIRNSYFNGMYDLNL